MRIHSLPVQQDRAHSHCPWAGDIADWIVSAVNRSGRGDTTRGERAAKGKGIGLGTPHLGAGDHGHKMVGYPHFGEDILQRDVPVAHNSQTHPVVDQPIEGAWHIRKHRKAQALQQHVGQLGNRWVIAGQGSSQHLSAFGAQPGEPTAIAPAQVMAAVVGNLGGQGPGNRRPGVMMASGRQQTLQAWHRRIEVHQGSHGVQQDRPNRGWMSLARHAL